MRRNVLHINDGMDLEVGGHLDSVNLVYHTSDHEYRKGEKVVWICHALTGNSDPSDWWPDIVGPGKLFDTDTMFVVCVSMLGSPYGECSPATVNPATGKPYLLDFPMVTVRDMTNSCIAVRKALGIERVDILMGPSIGGFQAVEWTIMEPDVIDKAVFLATAMRVTPIVTAYNESQRMALLADPTFKEAKSIEGGREGLKCARSIALLSYRTSLGYNMTQYELDDDTVFADRAASYQRYQGEKLVRRLFDAYGYWYLSYALDSMNAGRGRGGLAKALAQIKAECSIISITNDIVFPPYQLKEAAEMIKNAKYHEIESAFGHDGFFLEKEALSAILKPLLA